MEVLEYTTVKRFLGRQSVSSRGTIKHVLKDFTEWSSLNGGPYSSMNPDELVAYQTKANEEGNGNRFKILDLVQDYINSKNTLRYNSKVRYYSLLRSFFANNRADLPPDKGYTISSDIPQVKETLTVEEVRSMILSSKPVYQAIIASMFMSAMDQEMYKFWNLNGWPSLKKQLDEKAQIVKIDLPGRKRRKNKVPFYTFISGDALEAVRRYVENHRPSDKKGEPTTAIFLDQHNNPLAKASLAHYWKRHANAIGLYKSVKNGPATTRHGKGMHTMRDLFRTLWEKSPASGTAAEFFMGHEVDPLGYNQIMRDESYARKEYMKAVKYLNLLTSDAVYGKVSEDDYERQDTRIAELEGELYKIRAEKVDLSTQIIQLKEEREEESAALKRIMETVARLETSQDKQAKRLEALEVEEV